jgi:hypothetical protein|tara:strand:- start:175 stop:312 length:138 start_codon:yes stop_codon:yes gene_type:complete
MPKVSTSFLREEKKKKKGVHSKNKNSKSKASKFYKKKYRGQGKRR